MKAQITATHTLWLDEWMGSILPAVPWSDSLPGTGICYVTDHGGKLVPNVWSEVALGPFDARYYRAAYDHATRALAAITPSSQFTPFDQLAWVP